MTGIRAQRGFFRMTARNCAPLIDGIRMSIRIACGSIRPYVMSLSAAGALRATETSNPSDAMRSSRDSRTSSSSSMIRILRAGMNGNQRVLPIESVRIPLPAAKSPASARRQFFQIRAQMAVDGVARELLFGGVCDREARLGRAAHCVGSRSEREHADRDSGDGGEGQFHAHTVSPLDDPSTFV